MDEKCDLYDSCRKNREDEIAFRASLTTQMENAVQTLTNIAQSVKDNNEKHWEVIGKITSQIEQECKDRITADGHIENKLSFERGKFVGYAVLISTITAVGGVILSKII